MKKSWSKTLSVSSRRRIQLEPIILEEKALVDVIALEEKTAMRQKQGKMEFGAQNKAQESAGIKREKKLEINIKKLELEVRWCFSRSSLSNVSSFIRAEDRSKSLVKSPINKHGEMGDPTVTAAKLMTNSQ